MVGDVFSSTKHLTPPLNLLPRFVHPALHLQFRATNRPSWLEKGSDEAYEDGPLPAILSTLRGIHAAFFELRDAGHPGDVRPALAAARAHLLAGARLLLSRVVPLESPDPARHPVWRLAEVCGASCTLQADARVTHVVAPDWTTKVLWGHDHGKTLVHPDWIVQTGEALRMR